MAATPVRKPKVNIRAIAEHVQLSPTTVSLALRGAVRIPEETRARVLNAARELQYVYTPRAVVEAVAPRRLAFVMAASGSKSTVALDSFFGQLLQGAEQACNVYDAALTFSILPYDADPALPLPATLRHAAVDGLMLAGEYAMQTIERVQRAINRPIVLVDNFIPGMPHDSVNADDFGGGYLAAQHLIGLGHTQLSVIAGHPLIPSLRERQRGFLAACAAAGIEPGPTLHTSPTWNAQTIRRELEQQLQTLPLPNAFFCTIDDYAIMALEWYRAANIAVPKQVSIIGFDDLENTRVNYPMLTTLRNHPLALGEVAVERLLARIEGDQRPHQHINLGVQLMVRESTAAQTT